MKNGLYSSLILLLSLFPVAGAGQQNALKDFLADSALAHASVSFCIMDADSGRIICEHDSDKSLTPASVMKLITSGVALEMLGPDFRFTTTIGYRGSFNKQTGRLKGDLIIRGGGDPALGSEYFADHYGKFPEKWVDEIKGLGINKIDGRIIADDSYFDYFPDPPKWPWEDLGNYYGAGVYGLSAYDNTVLLHFKTGKEGTPAILVSTEPSDYSYNYNNTLISKGNSDEGYVFAAPYSTTGWITGTIPSEKNDFVLKASIADPPLLLAEQLTRLLKAQGIRIAGDPATTRKTGEGAADDLIVISQIFSPPLADIIETLNHESVNLYAETLLKQLGKSARNEGSVSAGLEAVNGYLSNAGIDKSGFFIEDGSGLSPRDAINSRGLSEFLLYLKNHGSYFTYYLNSLPEAGKNGTLKYCFRDSLFLSRLRAKSGSMERVRCYAGYFSTLTGKNRIFTILVNNFNGSSSIVITGIERILSEAISDK
jgi:serine-type D-Ala-D-Ala carboxypeptidase/endopeptidase (penicillin-binding protein 4)